MKEKNGYSPQDVFAVKQAEDVLSKRKLFGKGLLTASCAIVVIICIIFFLSLLYSENGSFTVRTDRLEDGALISLSETPGFANPTTKLSGSPKDGMDDTTYEWLPLDELDTIPGSHNGEKYIAYTFYVKCINEEHMDYTISFDVLEATRGIEGAVRVMIYRNGVPTIYASPRADGGVESVPDKVVNFTSPNTVVKDIVSLDAGQMNKYTVVIWLEGEDPECNNSILTGIMKFEVKLRILEEEITDQLS